MTALLKFFGLSFTALLPLVNPLGDALVFLGMVGPAPPAIYRRLAQRVAVNTTLFLILIEVAGAAIMKFFGISLPVMQVSGGLVLAAMGWSLLNQDDPKPADEHPATMQTAGLPSLESKTFYPLTFPITAGPGCIVVTITLSAQASAQGGFADLAAHGGIAFAVVALGVAVYVCYGFAPTIASRIKPQTAHGIQRVIAFVLLSIGVQILWNGLAALIATLPR
jgi:multiple antibiotic resistance protein